VPDAPGEGAEPPGRQNSASAAAHGTSPPPPSTAESHSRGPEPATAETPPDELTFAVLIRFDPETADWITLAETTAEQLDTDERSLDGTGLDWVRERSARTSDERAVLALVPRTKTDAWSRLQVLVALARKMPWVIGSAVMRGGPGDSGARAP